MASSEAVVETRIHTITTVHMGARRQRRKLAACPREHKAVDAEACATCPAARGFVEGGSMSDEASVRCAIDRRATVEEEPGSVGGLMRREVLCVRPDVAVGDVVLLFVERSIGGVPVVDENDKPIGMISKSDLIQVYAREHLRRGNILDSFDADVAALPDPIMASDVMTPVVFTLREAESVARAAELFASKQVHRAPVVGSDGRVVGVLTSFDIVRSLAGAP